MVAQYMLKYFAYVRMILRPHEQNSKEFDNPKKD